MSHDPQAIANWFYDQSERDGRSDLTPMKLQKLVYFSHGWYLALENAPLISESVEAWRWGPVVPSLYREFKEYGPDTIPRRARDLRFEGGRLMQYEPRIDNASVKGFLRVLWNTYKDYTAIQLSNMTHEPGSPWDTVASKYQYNLPMGINIPNDLIQDYFKKL